MSLRYYVLGSIAFICVLYFSKEIRDVLSSKGVRDILPSLPSWQGEPVMASPRMATSSHPLPEAKRVLHEKTALEDWIQSRLTQQGLKEMTEAGHWQSEHSWAL